MNIHDLVFLDLETTGLERQHVPWEVAAIDLYGNVLIHEMWMPADWQMDAASAMALKMTRFYQRMYDPAESSLRGRDARYIAKTLAITLSDKTLAGAAIHFDMGMLDRLLRDHGHVGTWSHRPLDIETYAAGVFGHTGPASLGDTAKRAGIEYEKEKKHSALYDAWLAREVYRACLTEVGADSIEKIAFEDLGIAPHPRGQDSAVAIPTMPTPPPMDEVVKE